VPSAVGPGPGIAGADLDGAGGASDPPDLADPVGGTANPHKLNPQGSLRGDPKPSGAELAADIDEATNCWRGVAVSRLDDALADDADDALDLAAALDDADALADDAAALDDAALNAAVDERPDLLLASTRVDRARLASDLEHLKRLPDPTVNAGYKRTAGQNTAVAGVILAVPLFDRNGQARALAEAGVKSAAADRQSAHLRAVAEASAAIAAATQLATSLTQVRRDLLVPAEGVRNAAQALFREGATDVLKLVDAERIYADVRREALALAVDAYVAAIEARFAVAQEDIP